MNFKLKLIPPTATAQQKGERIVGGYIHHYKKKNVAAAEAILRDALLRGRCYSPPDSTRRNTHG